MKINKIYNCMYGGVALECLLLLNSAKNLVLSKGAINFLGAGLMIPSWFVVAFGAIPVASILSLLFTGDNSKEETERLKKEIQMEKINDLVSKYNKSN